MRLNPEYRYALVPIDMPDGKKVGFVVRIGPPPPPAGSVRRKHKAIIAAAEAVTGEAIVDQGKTRTFDTKAEAEKYGKSIGYPPKRYLDSTKEKKKAANPMTDYDLSEPWPGSPGAGDPLPPTHPHLYGVGKPSIDLFDHVQIFTSPGYIKGQVLHVSGKGLAKRYVVKTKDGNIVVHEHYIEKTRPGPKGDKARRKLYGERREAMRGELRNNPSAETTAPSAETTAPSVDTKKLKTRLLK